MASNVESAPSVEAKETAGVDATPTPTSPAPAPEQQQQQQQQQQQPAPLAAGEIPVKPQPKPKDDKKERRASLLKRIEARHNGTAELTTSEKVVQWTDSLVPMIVMTVATIYALLGDDFRLAFCPPESDTAFHSLSVIALVLFVAEFVIFCIFKKDYLGGFFFILDLVAVFSLIPDIPWIWNPLYKAIAGENPDESEQDLTVARASRASRAGTRATKFVRFIRLVRLIRVVKLYKLAQQRNEVDENGELIEEPEETFADGVSGSNVGKKLTDVTTRRVIIGVLLMLFIIPLLEVETTNTRASFAVSQLDYYNDRGQPSAFVGERIADIQTTWGSDLLYLKAFGTVYQTDRSSTHRSSEMVKLTVTDAGVHSIEMIYSKRANTQLAAGFSLLMTVLVVLLLGLGAYLFNKDAQESVVGPIEQMVEFVEKLALNPLQKIAPREESDDTGFETVVLEDTLRSLAQLLQIGFGDAGAEIIAEIIAQGETKDGNIDPMIDGQKTFAIFGFCDVRYFSDATEFLKEEVLVFVNQIAYIVHRNASDSYGCVNKNIGNAFLIVWKPRQELIAPERLKAAQAAAASGTTGTGATEAKRKLTEEEELNKYLQENPLVKAGLEVQSNNALMGFLDTIVEVKTTPELQSWREHKSLVSNNWHISMGFGLHVGWAIEGAIGSALKIDASYLSPNVNMSSRLEAATKQYHASLLFSGPFWGLLQPEVQRRSRLLDVVTVKGSEQPLRLYTYDLAVEQDEVNAAHAKQPLDLMQYWAQGQQSGKYKIKMSFDYEAEKAAEAEAGSATSTPAAVPDGATAIEMKELQGGKKKGPKRQTTVRQRPWPVGQALLDKFADYQDGLPAQWIERYTAAVEDLYLKGKWQAAKTALEELQKQYPGDGPVQTIMEVMAEAGFEAPATYNGSRALTKK